MGLVARRRRGSALARAGAAASLTAALLAAACTAEGSDAGEPIVTAVSTAGPGDPVGGQASSAPATASAPPTTAAPEADPAPTPTNATAGAPRTSAPAGEGALPPPSPGPLSWTDCGGGFQCADLEVPLDHARPGGDRIRIALIRRPATGDTRLGSVVLNPGGPGGSGVQFLRAAAGGLRLLNRQFDLVSFDPRGVGASEPAFRCHDDLDDRVDVIGPGGLTEARFQASLEADKQRCSTADPALLAHIGTNAAARDLDWLRAALGDAKLTYLGFSYGTRLGAAYVELFPSTAGAIALDGADLPTRALSRSVGDQFAGFEASFRRFIAWCDDPGRDCPTDDLGGVEATFRSVERRLREQGPLPTELGQRRLTLGEFYLGVIAALYSEANWPGLAAALANAEALEDGTALQQFVDSLADRRPDGSYANTLDANVAINCADDPERPTFADALARGRELARGLPLLGPLAETAFMDCVGWAAPAEPVALPSGKAAVPVLVIGTTGDPATPYPWAAELARALVSARLLTYRGEGHTAYFTSTCVRDAVDAYLTTGALHQGGDC